MDIAEILQNAFIGALVVGLLWFLAELLRWMKDGTDKSIKKEAYEKALEKWRDSIDKQAKATIELYRMVKEEEESLARYDEAVQMLHEECKEQKLFVEKLLAHQEACKNAENRNDDGNHRDDE